MAADPTLVNMAYRVASGGTTAAGFGKQGSFAKFLGKTFNAASKVLTNHVKTKSKEFEAISKEALSNASEELSDEDWAMRYDQVDSLRRDYILGNRKTRAEILRQIDGLGREQQQHIDVKAGIVTSTLVGKAGLNKNFMATEQGLGVQGILNGNTPITYNNETGEPGYMLSNNGNLDNFETAKDYFLSKNNLDVDSLEKYGWDIYGDSDKAKQLRERMVMFYTAGQLATEGGKTRAELDGMFGKKWHSMQEVKDILREQSFDMTSSKLILGKGKEDYLKSKNLISGNGSFPYEEAYDDTNKTIISLDTANRRSLSHDEIIAGSGRTWYTDMQEALMDKNYSDLGIPLTEEEAKAMDPTQEDGITPNDARRIIRAIESDDDLHSDFLTSYYTHFRQQNWNKGAMERTNWTPPKEITKQDDDPVITENVTTQEDPAPIIELGNGDKKVWDATTQKYIYVPKEREIDESNTQNFKPSYERTIGGNLYDNRPLGHGQMK